MTQRDNAGWLFCYGVLFVVLFSLLTGVSQRYETISTTPDTVNRIHKFEIIYDSSQIRAYDSLLKVYRCSGKRLN